MLEPRGRGARERSGGAPRAAGHAVDRAAPPGGGHRDGDRDGRRRRADARRRAGRVRADRPPPPRRDAHARARAPAGPGRAWSRRTSALVAVDVGPGLFTGLRVGVAAAKGLAQSLGIGVVGATSLDILTAGAAGAGHRGLVLACVDARRGEVFAARARARWPGGRRGGADRRPACSRRPTWWPRSAVLGGAPVLAVGDGARATAAVLEAVPGVETAAPRLSFPPPAALLDLALARLEAGESPVEPAFVVPLYMREADATSNFARAERA